MGDGGAARWINRILVVIVFFIGLHVVFVLFDGNPRNGIVQFVHAIARLFLLPFRGMFPDQSRLVTALIAVISYSVLAGVALAINRSIRSAIAKRDGRPAPGTPTDVDTTRRV